MKTYRIKNIPQAQYGMQMPQPIPQYQGGGKIRKKRATNRELAQKNRLWPVVNEAAALAAEKYGLDLDDLLDQIVRENGSLDPTRTSKSGNIGIPQFGADTWPAYGLTRKILRSKKPEDITTSIEAMGHYMYDLRKQFNGDAIKATIAYNWGPGAYSHYLKQDDPRYMTMPTETRNYVRDITDVDPVTMKAIPGSVGARRMENRAELERQARIAAGDTPQLSTDPAQPSTIEGVTVTAPRTSRGEINPAPSRPSVVPPNQATPTRMELPKNGFYPIGEFSRNPPVPGAPPGLAPTAPSPEVPRLRLPQSTIFPGVENDMGEMPFEGGVPGGSALAENIYSPQSQPFQGGAAQASSQDPVIDMGNFYKSQANAWRVAGEEKDKALRKKELESVTKRNKVRPRDLMGELYALSDTPDFVPGQQFNPQLLTPYQISLQDRLNQANSTFRAAATRINNPESLAALAAQKYEVDNSILGEQFRLNQSQANQVYNQNVQTLNQASLQNLQLADQQFQRQAAAQANTNNRKQQALTSIGNKYSQKQSENAQFKLYENMFNFRQDEEGNFQSTNPDWFVNPANAAYRSQFGKRTKKTDQYGNESYSEDLLSELQELIADRKAKKELNEFSLGGSVTKRWGGAIKRMK